jgi:hypothetical protein
MPTDWTNIRVPRDLHARIADLAEEMEQRAINCDPPKFLSQLPWEFKEYGVPLWWVIQRAMKEFEDHRRRSSRSGKTRKRQ